MNTTRRWVRPGFFFLLWGAGMTLLGQPEEPPWYGERVLSHYFRRQVEQLASSGLDRIETLEEWTERRPELQRQLWEMLGLWPVPERTDLKAEVTGRVEHPDFVVEKLHFQSMPGLYVTANLYLPRRAEGPLPAVLYVCGHGNVKKDGVSYGSKVNYQHHPAWFARNGFVSLILDTLQLGEIEGLHHGTHREGMWWWISRGYTPAGVEAWNSIRALDYLQSRPEVDPQRLGITGRSGGGAYSWWVAALDERVRAVVPVAGITDLQNHVVDGAIEGHCDCMYMVNRYRWDFPLVAALVAPRPLLLANTDRDPIFPLDGVMRLYWKLRRLYRLYGAEEHLGLLITDGPHQDTQELRVPAFSWMNRWLKDQRPVVEDTGEKPLAAEDLKVFSVLPADQRNTRIHESFVPQAPVPPVPEDSAAWEALRARWLEELRQTSFAGWPKLESPLTPRRILERSQAQLQLAVYEFFSEEEYPLWLWVAGPRSAPLQEMELRVLDETRFWQSMESLSRLFGGGVLPEIGPGPSPSLQPAPGAAEVERLGRVLAERRVAFFAPRGVGPTAWRSEKDTHIRRRFVLLGQTLEGMQVWDVRRAVSALRSLPDLQNAPLRLTGEKKMGAIALLASLFAPQVDRLEVVNLPSSYREGPALIAAARILDLPQLMALALPALEVTLRTDRPEAWEWPETLARRLGSTARFHLLADSQPHP